MTIFYSDVEPLSKYFPVPLHLSPYTRILNENPVKRQEYVFTQAGENCDFHPTFQHIRPRYCVAKCIPIMRV